jgi:hypothetical protein
MEGDSGAAGADPRLARIAVQSAEAGRMGSIPGVALALLLFVLSACTSGVEPWARVFHGADHDALFDVVEIDDAHAVVVGATGYRHVPPYRGDALIMTVDTRDGTVVRERTWGGSGFDQAWGVAQAADGGVYVFGETDSYGAGDRDFFLLKLDARDEVEWYRTYGTPAREWPFGLLPLADGDLLLYGRTVGDAGTEDAYAVRVGPGGDVVWEYLDPTPDDVLILDALETADNVIILGTSIARDGGLTALDAEGRYLWDRRYELDGWQYASSIATVDDGFLLAGFSMTGSGEDGHPDAWLAGTSADGALRWHTSFGDPESDDYALDLRRLADGSYLLGGFGRGMPVWRVDGSGNLLGERRLEDTAMYGAFSIVQLDDGGLLVAGLEVIVAARSSDAVLVRTDPDGRMPAARAPRTR